MEQNGKIHTILVLLELQRSLRHQVKPQDSVMFDHSSSVTAVAAATSVQLQPIDFFAGLSARRQRAAGHWT